MCILTQTVHLLESIIDVLHACHISSFTGKLTKTRRAIQGYGGVEVYDVYKGTLKWKIEDDKGRHHTIYIPGHTSQE
jgi:hypothetical protein